MYFICVAHTYVPPPPLRAHARGFAIVWIALSFSLECVLEAPHHLVCIFCTSCGQSMAMCSASIRDRDWFFGSEQRAISIETEQQVLFPFLQQHSSRLHGDAGLESRRGRKGEQGAQASNAATTTSAIAPIAAPPTTTLRLQSLIHQFAAPPSQWLPHPRRTNTPSCSPRTMSAATFP